MTEAFLSKLKTYQIDLPKITSKLQQGKQKLKTDAIHPSYFDLKNTVVLDATIPSQPKEENEYLKRLKDKMIQGESNIKCCFRNDSKEVNDELQNLKRDIIIFKKSISPLIKKHAKSREIQTLLFQKDYIQVMNMSLNEKKRNILFRIAKRFCDAYNSQTIANIIIIKNYELFTDEYQKQSKNVDKMLYGLHIKQEKIDLKLEEIMLSPEFDDFLTKVNQLFRLHVQSLIPLL